MSDNNSHSNSFDDLFRRKEDPVDISFREEDWLKLEKKLDAYDARLLNRRRLGYVLAAAILLIAMMGYLTSDIRLELDQSGRNADDQIASNEGVMESDLGTTADTDSQQPEAESEDKNQLSQTPSVPDEYATNQDQRSNPNTTAVDSSGIDTSFASMTIGHVDFQLMTDCTECSSNSLSERDPPEFSVDYDRVEIQKMKTEKTQASLLASDDRREKLLAGMHAARLSGFSIGVKAAPDLSTVDGLTNFESPGYSFGFEIAYRMNERFSISTGISRSVVRYRADGKSYDTPVYLNGGVVADQMSGECVLLDIPLSLRMNLLSFSESRVFATGSLSSYIMLNEVYRFDADNSYGSAQEYNYQEKTGTSHLMSNAGLSIGYEYDLNSNFSIRVEPQIKIPIRDVGVTNVRLFSLGSFFSLSYNL